MLAQLAAALLAGRAFSGWSGRSAPLAALVGVSVMTVSLLEYQAIAGPQVAGRSSGRTVQYVTMVKPPPLELIPLSPVLGQLGPTDRVLAPDGNTLSLGGASCVRPYLGLGPAVYFDVWDRMPNLFQGPLPEAERKRAIAIIRAMAVTHILTEKPLGEGWPVEAVWIGVDPFLHRRWGRDPREPLHLYRVRGARGRAWLETAGGAPLVGGSAVIESYNPGRVTIRVRTPTAGRVVLADLMFPGWSVSVSGEAAATIRTAAATGGDSTRPVGGSKQAGAAWRPPSSTEIYRVTEVPAGESVVEWRYDPGSLRAGLVTAALGVVGLVAMALVGRPGARRPGP
jgi:hypothetical protein